MGFALRAREFAPPYEECRALIEKARWGKGVRCPFCSSTAVVRCGLDEKGFQRYLCKDCVRRFNARTGTMFEGSKLEIWEWFYLMKEREDGRSIRSIANDLRRPYNTIHRAAKRMENDMLAGRITSMLKSGQSGEYKIGKPQKGNSENGGRLRTRNKDLRDCKRKEDDSRNRD